MLKMLDIYIAFGLLFAVVAVYLANRVGVLPKKSLPVIIGALAGAIGFTLFRRWQGRAVDAQIAELKSRITKRDVHLKELEGKHKLAEAELAAATVNLDRQLATAQKQRMQIVSASEKERERIDNLSVDDTNTEYYKMLEEEAKYQASKRVAQPAPSAGGGGGGG